VAGPRHGARHQTIPLHGRPVPRPGEPVGRGRRSAGTRRLRAGQSDASSPDAAPRRRSAAGQGRGDRGRTAASRALRQRERGRDRVRHVGHGVRRRRRQRTGGRRRVYGRRFHGKYPRPTVVRLAHRVYARILFDALYVILKLRRRSARIL